MSGQWEFSVPLVANIMVRNGASAVEFYKRALGAVELNRVTNPSGDVLAELSVHGVPLIVSDESPRFHNYSPQTLGDRSTVRFNIYVDDPDAAHAKAIAEGAREIYKVTNQPWGIRQGRVVDPYGHHWMFSKPMDGTPGASDQAPGRTSEKAPA